MLSLAKPPRGKGTISVDSAISSSASSISSTDVIFQILLHVPLSKSLLACKSVSKQWYSIISDPQFLREKHRIQNGNRLKIPGFFLKKKGNLAKRDYDYICIDRNFSSTTVPFKTLKFAGEEKRILRSCNGLLLCTDNWDTAAMTYLKYYIYNPFTKQYKILPPLNRPYISGGDKRYLSVSDIELAFDPLNSLYYKVICIWSMYNDPSVKKRIGIYSSETSSWRLCKKAYTFPDFHRSCVFWNGSLNLITDDKSLFYFDIGQETVGQVLFPREKDSRNWYTPGSNCLDVYGGHLLFILMNLDISTRFDVMEMETDHTGWILKYKVDMEGLKASYPELGGSCSYTVIFIDEVEEFSPKFIVLIYDSNVIISYDSEENSCTILHDVHEWNTRWYIPVVCYKYVESLACV